jgi:hypothetical protein
MKHMAAKGELSYKLQGRWRPMIDLYCWTTTNGQKITICLEEVGLPTTFVR